MKKIEKKMEITKHYFQAADGTNFEYEYENDMSEEQASNRCKDYERNLNCVLMQRLEGKLRKADNVDKENSWKISAAFGADEDSYIYLFTPENENDIKNLLMLVEEEGEWFYSSKRILKDLKPNEKYIVIREESDYFNIVSKAILDERINDMTNSFDKIINYDFDKEEKEE